MVLYGKRQRKRLWIFVALLLCFSIAGLLFAPWVDRFYVHNRGVSNPFTDYIIGLIVAISISVIVYFFASRMSYGSWFLFSWIMALGCALFAMLPYEKYYKILDAYTYYEQAHFASAAWDFQLYNLVSGTANVIRFTTLLRAIFQSYRAIVIIFAFLGTVGRYFFFISLQCLYPSRTNLLVLFWPSLVFWTSTLGKDPLTILGSSLLFLAFIRYYVHRILSRSLVLVVTLGLLLLLLVRFYFAVILGLGFVLGVFILRLRKLTPIVIIILSFSIMSAVAYWGFQKLSPIEFTSFLSEYSRSFAHGGSAQRIPWQSIGEYFLWLPWVIFSIWFRPFPWEFQSLFSKLVGVENIALLFLTITTFGTCLYRGKIKKFSFFLLLTLIVWSCIMGLAIYQNLGTASRIRSSQALPFLITFITSSLSNHRLGRS